MAVDLKTSNAPTKLLFLQASIMCVCVYGCMRIYLHLWVD